MKRTILFLMLVACISFAGCRNFSTYNETLDKDGKVVSKSSVEYRSKFTDKNVAIISEVEAFKVTTSTDTSSGNMFPQVAFGWFWLALLELNVTSGGELFFYKENSHWMVDNTSGRTMLYIKNTTDVDQNVKVESKPKLFIATPFFSFGTGTNKTKVEITPGKATPKKPVVISEATGGNTMTVIQKEPEKKEALLDKLNPF